MASIAESAGLFPLGLTNFCRALPPGAMSIKELKALLSDKRLEIFLDKVQVIHSIIANERGYLITTAYQSLQVDVSYEPSGIGIPRIILAFQEPRRLPNPFQSIDLRWKDPAKDCIRFLRKMIKSSRLWDLLGSTDRITHIILTDEAYCFDTHLGNRITASFRNIF